ERLRTGHFVDQVTVDEDQAGAVVPSLNDVFIPDLFVECAWFAGHAGQMAREPPQGKQALSIAGSSTRLFGARGDPCSGESDRYPRRREPRSTHRQPGDKRAEGQGQQCRTLRLAGNCPPLAPVADRRAPAWVAEHARFPFRIATREAEGSKQQEG